MQNGAQEDNVLMEEWLLMMGLFIAANLGTENMN